MTRQMVRRSWSRTLRRRSDGVESVYMGHRTYLDAVADAQEVFCDEDVDAVWVTRNLEGGKSGPVIFSLTTGPGGCRVCGWPPGQGHAPGVDCGEPNGVSTAKLAAALAGYDEAAAAFRDAGDLHDVVRQRGAMHDAGAVLAEAVRELLTEEGH